MNCPCHILIYADTLQATAICPCAWASSALSIVTSAPASCTACCACAALPRTTPTSSAPPSRSKTKSSSCLEFAARSPSKTFGFDKYEAELSTWDTGASGKIDGRPDQWKLGRAIRCENALKRRNIEYKSIPDEAAFYGPKIDIKLVDAIGRLWQLSTVQFDFTLPERFELEYIGEDGKRHQPLMVHRALYGSIERFFGVLIEHYAGAFPVWLSPVQVAIIPIGEKHQGYAYEVSEKLKAAGVRVHVDARNEKMNAKIPRTRDAESAIPVGARRPRNGIPRSQRPR